MKTPLFFIATMLTLVVSCSKYEELQNNRIEPHDLLSDDKYRLLVVEIQYIDGYGPDTEASEKLRQLLTKHLNKPGGIVLQFRAIEGPSKSVYDISDIQAIEKDKRTHYVDGNTVSAYFLFLNGSYAGDSPDRKVLGVAYGSTSMAVFGKTIEEFSGGIGQPSTSKLQTTVMQHEFGHILGLVNTGSRMVHPHEDGSHPHHCDNNSCLMNATAETSAVANLLFSGDVPTLDQNCINDLIANGGK